MSSFVGQSFILPMTKAVRCGVFAGKLRCVGLVYLGFADPCVFLFNFEWTLLLYLHMTTLVLLSSDRMRMEQVHRQWDSVAHWV